MDISSNKAVLNTPLHICTHTPSLTQLTHLHPTSNTLTHPHTHKPSLDKKCYFYYSLLCNDITSEPFSPTSFRPERASIRVRTSRELLGLLLAAQDDLQVQAPVYHMGDTTALYTCTSYI